MSRCLLLPPTGDVTEQACRLLLESGRPLETCLAVFPGKRPGHFLRQKLARALGRAYRPPAILSMDELAERLAERAGRCGRQVEALEAATMLAGQCGSSMPGGRMQPLERFLPWGFKLFADLEELKMELVEPERLKDFDSIAGERLPPGLQGMLSGLSGIYRGFYEKLQADGLSTRSSRYAAAASTPPEEHGLVILAGFFGLTAAEESILKLYSIWPQTTHLLKDGPGIGELLDRLGLQPERLEGRPPDTETRYYRATDTVCQAMALNRALEGGGTEGRCIVLPAPEALFPVADHVLGRFGGDWNVSLGYPLSRTPFMALVAGIGRMLETAEDGRLHAAEYLKVLLHPYVKNLDLGAGPRFTRMLCHAVEERLAETQARFVDPAEVERDPALAERMAHTAAQETGEPSLPAVRALEGIHGLVVRNFEGIRDIGEFAGKLLDLVEAVAERGTAQQHPYAASFLERAAGELKSLSGGPMARLPLGSLHSYFGFIEAGLAPAKVPYPGTPLRGLQVLGFLETRNLAFEEVFILDANEGVLPHQGPVETLLPPGLRRELGLPDHARAEAAVRYHLHCLLAGARKAHLFHSRGRGGEPSRFVEELWWGEQRSEGRLGIRRLHTVHFSASFGQRDPSPVAKTPRMMEALEARTFSASSLDAYLHCPLRFLYSRLLGLEPKNGSGGDVEQTQLGSLVHRILNRFYSGDAPRKPADAMGGFDRMERIVRDQFREAFGPHLDGRLALARLQTENRMRAVLESERLRKPTVLYCERELAGSLELGGGRRAPIKGTIDRIEEVEGRVNIIDYKTGSSARVPQKSFDPSRRDRWHRTLGSVQLPLYFELFRQNFPMEKREVDCGLMLLGSKNIKNEWLFRDRGEDPGELHSRYLGTIAVLVGEILDPELPFGPAPDPQASCPGCDFKVICGRQWMDR